MDFFNSRVDELKKHIEKLDGAQEGPLGERRKTSAQKAIDSATKELDSESHLKANPKQQNSILVNSSPVDNNLTENTRVQQLVNGTLTQPQGKGSCEALKS